MSIRIPFPPAASLDGRAHREEDITLARTASNKNARPAVPETPDGAAAAKVEAALALPPASNRRRVVLPDPIAFKFLEGDPTVTVITRKYVLPGYELYLVEQWACSRQSPALVIATYTADPKHSVVVGVLEIPGEEKDWSPRLRLYFSAIQHYHARPKETDIGELMVTNLSSFPSALTVIAVPDGDIQKHRQVFIVNENLKRLGCSGRSGLTLTDPTPATQAKFLQLYKTNEKIPFAQAVLELVRMCQMALHIFGMLDAEYVDGLLCDVTETAINNWWTEIGSEYFNTEPTDGILGPTTVAAMLGTLMGARNRLSYSGAPVAKDVFDLESTKKGIGTFQKSVKIERTRRLDRQTLLKLHSATAKAAAGDGGWGVHRAVKSTVAEIGGKRGELVIGMVGGKDKANIGDIETVDLGKFINLAYGERPKWLWHGKPRRTQQETAPGSAFGKELREETIVPQSGSRRTQSAPVEDELEAKKREDSPAIYAPPPVTNSAPITAESHNPGDRDALRKGIFKGVAGKVSDARSGLGRIRDAVGGGLRGHASRPSKDESPDTAISGYSSPSIATLAHSSAAVTSPVAVGKAFSWKVKPEEYANGAPKERDFGETGPSGLNGSAEGSETHPTGVRAESTSSQELLRAAEEKEALAEIRKDVLENTFSAAASEAGDLDAQPQQFLGAQGSSDLPLSFLQRRHSFTTIEALQRPLNDARYPRRLSFSEAEEAVLGWHEIISLADLPPPDAGVDPATTAFLQSQAELAYTLYHRLQEIQKDLANWVTGKLSGVDILNTTYGAQQAELQALYHAVSEAYARIRHSSGELVAEERGRLTEAVKDVEVLVAKLEYEISALVGKVNEVEDGVAQFEAQVEDLERRAEELKAALETESWAHCLVRTLTGIGSGPNITRARSR
ncbi:uncharacterized protein PODANS_1_1740 [Podospora anserina S mat+]|uniref:Podospora anserina S mat+ genomic DNA chromosome 1, supercontig 1 n=1 Tax=Podospora anserina (strain S / ATCC MYA-4624 / DSM 980 / FGSC 10383) TaxID=515849 RepID=B2A9T6_PODAN|nr:uncharacterized protein PODANS_1_1740 [Podospora anserina S mat+]CAP59846.1 unnamed protein product [Podospora anserina S mat+]CDP22489.1 Putative protein similar to STB2 of Saccharomyces cerevisiae [Podospora anserina S mat+]